jgi:probable F420-dependent oxidoreductase
LASRPFRFGVTRSTADSREAWIAAARKSAELGFSTISMPDHVGISHFAIAPSLVLAAEAAPALRVGSFVYDNDFRNPVLLAQEIATIDRLTDGRFEFGLGAGWQLRDYEQTGLRFDAGAVRVARMQESFLLIMRLLQEKAVTFAGTHYQVKDAEGYPCVQRPHPPVLIGGGGPRLLSFAAKHADIISILPRSRADGEGFDVQDAGAASFDQKISWIRAAAMNRFAQLELNVLIQAVMITSDRAAVAEALATQFHAPVAELLESPLILVGTTDQIAGDLEARRARFGISYITVFDRDMEAMAPVIERLKGR